MCSYDLKVGREYFITMIDDYKFSGVFVREERGFLVFLEREEDREAPIRKSNIRSICEK